MTSILNHLIRTFCLAKEKEKTYEKVVQLMNIALAFGILPFKYMEELAYVTMKENFQTTSGIVNQI